MKRPAIILFSSFLLLAFSVEAQEGVKIRKQVSGLVQKLAQSYKQGKDLTAKANVAVADLVNDTDLTKKKHIGQAVRDLIQTEISRSTVFGLVERADLEKVVREQQLQMTGLTDPGSAAKIGQILNADLILSGSVTELGDEFNVTIKLIDVESGQVISETVAINKQDVVDTAEALQNMAYVQKMGLGISLSMLGHTAFGQFPTYVPASGGGNFAETAVSYPAGVEVRYRITKNFMVGAGLDVISGQVFYKPNQSWTNLPYFPTGSTDHGNGPFHIVMDGVAIPITLYGNVNLSRRFNIFACAGVMLHQVEFTGLFDPSKGNGFGPNEFGPSILREFFVGFQFGAGFEYFLNPRVAISAKAGYDIRQHTIDLGPMWHLPGLAGTKLPIDMSGFSYQLNLSFYF
jgi:TolB-like protein